MSRTKAEALRLELPEVLDSSAAAALADRLRSMRGAPLEMNASEVRRVGGLCAQVLLSAASSWKVDGTRLTLSNPSPELMEALRLMGLETEHLTAGDQRA